MANALRNSVKPKGFVDGTSANDGEVIKTLIESFQYPRKGPGMMWDAAARKTRAQGGKIHMGTRITALSHDDKQGLWTITARKETGEEMTFTARHIISSAPIRELVHSFTAKPACAAAADRLRYRDFITVGLLLTRMKSRSWAATGSDAAFPPDNWIYIQEPDVRAGRLQIFNNWSPAMVADPALIALGVEYFCNRDDELWSLSDAKLEALAIRELQQIDLIDGNDVVKATVVRVPRAYPAYFGAYAEFAVIRAHVDTIENLFLVGRNGMHRYNNQDHSMLTAKAAIDNIASGRIDKQNIWDINVDDEYLEERETASA